MLAPMALNFSLASRDEVPTVLFIISISVVDVICEETPEKVINMNIGCDLGVTSVIKLYLMASEVMPHIETLKVMSEARK